LRKDSASASSAWTNSLTQLNLVTSGSSCCSQLRLGKKHVKNILALKAKLELTNSTRVSVCTDLQLSVSPSNIQNHFLAIQVHPCTPTAIELPQFDGPIDSNLYKIIYGIVFFMLSFFYLIQLLSPSFFHWVANDLLLHLKQTGGRE